MSTPRHFLVGILCSLFAIAAGRWAWVSFAGTRAHAASRPAPETPSEGRHYAQLEVELRSLQASVRSLRGEISGAMAEPRAARGDHPAETPPAAEAPAVREPPTAEQLGVLHQQNELEAFGFLDAVLSAEGLDRASTLETRRAAEAAIIENELPCQLADVSCNSSLCKATIRDASVSGETRATLSTLTLKPPFATQGRVFVPRDEGGDIAIFFSRPGRPFPELPDTD